MNIETLTHNFSSSKLVRNEEMEGREYLVAPMIMMVEGVHSGSNGPLYYPAEELEKYVGVWNSKPVVVYHPEINGVGVSACDPDIFTTYKVGVIMNAKFEDGKLKAEAWIEKDRAEKVDSRIMQFIEEGKMMEVSTGLFTENEDTQGEFNGESYDAIARNYRPDHLALLPDKVGACSIEDGAGLLRLNEQQTQTLNKKLTEVVSDFTNSLVSKEKPVHNKLSHNNINEKLLHLTREKESPGVNEYVWVMDVFDDFFVYEISTNTSTRSFKQKYNIEDDVVSLEDLPEEVERVTMYKKKSDGSLVGNVGAIKQEEPEMDKEKVVDNIIANSAGMFTADDRDYLLGKDESYLSDLEQKAVTNAKGMKKDEKEEEEGMGKKKAPVGNSQAPAQEISKPATVEDYINNAPSEIREVLSAGIVANQNRRAQLVGIVSNHATNKFTAEQLNAMSTEQLEGMASLCSNSQPKQPEHPAVPNYMGAQQPASFVGNALEDDDPLVMPTID